MKMNSIALWLFVLLVVSPANGQVQFELEVNKTPEVTDDYLCWSPIQSRIRMTGAASNANVTLSTSQRSADGKQGEVWFEVSTGIIPTWTTFNPTNTISLTLPSNGEWVLFWVAGSKSSAGNLMPDDVTLAVDGKDTEIIVTDAGGTEQLRHPVMVRIRKNAEKLTDSERDRFLQALRALHDVDNIGTLAHDSEYVKYASGHGRAFFMGIHNSPAFPPWHRTMLLSLELELQAIDPSVALPYWKFDSTAPRLFSNRFIGIVSGSSQTVQFHEDNPLDGWRMPSEVLLTSWATGGRLPVSNQSLRRNNNASTSTPSVDLSAVLGSSSYSVMRAQMEGNYHNQVHNYIGGFLASLTSPRDPIFYLLHANVDRAWLTWQRNEGAFDHTNANHFFPQGQFDVDTSSLHQGSYVQDHQWPWNLESGNQGTPQTTDDWPPVVFELPASFANQGPSEIPVVSESIDFMNVLGASEPHNYSYDDIPFRR